MPSFNFKSSFLGLNNSKELKDHKNIKHLSVITPGFSADNIETLEEINMEGREEFLESGGKKFTYIPCLNDTKEGMDLLHKLALKELAGWI